MLYVIISYMCIWIHRIDIIISNIYIYICEFIYNPLGNSQKRWNPNDSRLRIVRAGTYTFQTSQSHSKCLPTNGKKWNMNELAIIDVTVVGPDQTFIIFYPHMLLFPLSIMSSPTYKIPNVLYLSELLLYTSTCNRQQLAALIRTFLAYPMHL